MTHGTLDTEHTHTSGTIRTCLETCQTHCPCHFQSSADLSAKLLVTAPRPPDPPQVNNSAERQPVVQSSLHFLLVYSNLHWTHSPYLNAADCPHSDGLFVPFHPLIKRKRKRGLQLLQADRQRRHRAGD
ncbi:unnamed protein product [Pleuronectes platessa]|uniref:Uncharacterized protein n=1 Tax=Pleuronectes platessa TaxID=8262 RepID=A0A9N7TLM0_PLEPL|nr:unnamed protein product [Pleuronectes platessa]